MIRRGTIKRRICTILVVLLFVAALGSSQLLLNMSAQAATIEISDCDELQAVDDVPATTSGDTLSLVDDIDCGGEDFVPLYQELNPFCFDGVNFTGFSGIFDGNGHTISNLTIDISASIVDTENGGLFACTKGALIRDVVLSGGSVTGNSAIGSFVGRAMETNFQNVRSSLTVTASDSSGMAGGLVGFFLAEGADASIADSSTTGDVLVGGEFTGGDDGGGLIGDLEVGAGDTLTISRSYTTGDVGNSFGTNEAAQVGGLVGMMGGDGGDLVIEDSYASGDITGDLGTGGLIGLIDYCHFCSGGASGSATISRSYASGHLTGNDGNPSLGGLIGFTWDIRPGESLTIEDSFSAAQLTATGAPDGYGGIVGGHFTNSGQSIASSNNYYDQNRAGTPLCGADYDVATEDMPSGCTRVNPAGGEPNYFKNNHTNAPLDQWDFDTVWITLANGFPVLGASTDSDNDSVPDVIESAAPNDGDANDDNEQDSEEGHVASLVNPTTNDYTALESAPACPVTSIAIIVPESANATQDSGFDYPFGMVDFSLRCATPGGATAVEQLYYDADDSGLILRKYQSANQAYFTLTDGNVEGLTIDGHSVVKASYELTDGSELDDDGTANGIVIDPAGLGRAVVGAPNTGLGGASRLD